MSLTRLCLGCSRHVALAQRHEQLCASTCTLTDSHSPCICVSNICQTQLLVISSRSFVMLIAISCFLSEHMQLLLCRFSYVALNCCSLLDRMDAINVPEAVKFLVTCRNFDGGFGCRPGTSLYFHVATPRSCEANSDVQS